MAQVAIALLDDQAVTGNRQHLSICFSDHHLTRIRHRCSFHTRRNRRDFRPQQRHGLGLHVGTHQRPVGIIMLEEGDQRCRNAYDLVWSHIHVVDIFVIVDSKSGGVAAGVAVQELIVFIQGSIRLGNNVLVFRVSRKIDIFISDKRAHLYGFCTQLKYFRCHRFCYPRITGIEHIAILIFDILHEQVVHQARVISGNGVVHLAIRGLDEPILINRRISSQTPDQANIRTFRGFNWANAAIV